MLIKIKNITGLTIPSSAFESDTGYDITATTEPEIVGERAGQGVDLWKRVDFIRYKTGLFISPESKKVGEPNYEILIRDNRDSLYGYTLLYPRSSVSKYNLILKNSVGVSDHKYLGELELRFAYTWQPEDSVYFTDHLGVVSYGRVNMDRIYKKGDKCAQLVAAWKEPIKWQLVDELGDSERGAGGFGSSGA
jgi:dUTPase